MEASPLLVASAFYNAAFGVFHLFFAKLFRWSEELPRLSKINRNVMRILNLHLTYVFFFMCVLFVVIAREGAHGLLPALLVGGMVLFWLMRAFGQVWFFGWRNAASNTLLGIFIAGLVLHFGAAASVWR